MISYVIFEIKDSNPQPAGKWHGAFAIITNVSTRLQKVRELSFRKWKIFITHGKAEESYVHDEFRRDLEMTLYIDTTKVRNCEEPENIRLLYEWIFEGLRYIWRSRAWNGEILDEMHAAIIKDDYKVVARVGKDYPSPNKLYKAQLYCEIYPQYTDLYIHFIGKGKKLYRTIYFLRGNSDPYMFYGVFSQHYWSDDNNFILCNYTGEIKYVFDVDKDDFNIVYDPINNTLEELQDYINAFKHDTPGKK